ncbi:unnamed protein product [Lampetra fluviatilis]
MAKGSGFASWLGTDRRGLAAAPPPRPPREVGGAWAPWQQQQQLSRASSRAPLTLGGIFQRASPRQLLGSPHNTGAREVTKSNLSQGRPDPPHPSSALDEHHLVAWEPPGFGAAAPSPRPTQEADVEMAPGPQEWGISTTCSGLADEARAVRLDGARIRLGRRKPELTRFVRRLPSRSNVEEAGVEVVGGGELRQRERESGRGERQCGGGGDVVVRVFADTWSCVHFADANQSVWGMTLKTTAA